MGAILLIIIISVSGGAASETTLTFPTSSLEVCRAVLEGMTAMQVEEDSNIYVCTQGNDWRITGFKPP